VDKLIIDPSAFQLSVAIRAKLERERVIGEVYNVEKLQKTLHCFIKLSLEPIAAEHNEKKAKSEAGIN